MVQIAIVSGKGGTGKTTLASSLSYLFENHVIADCDVDAPNMHLIFSPEIEERFEYFGGKKAVIDQEKCTKCGECLRVCRFDAIHFDGDRYEVDEYACEGCKACVIVCPEGAIDLVDSRSGEYYVSRTKVAPMVHALLRAGEETSGGLVAEVRKKAFETAKKLEKDVIVIDGAPGIGCPATSSVAGVDYVVVVSEPTMSGLHDLKRMVDTLRKMRRSFGVVINKYDLNEDMSGKIESWCEKENIKIIGKIPFDPVVARATREGKPVVVYDSPASRAIIEIFEVLSSMKEKLFRG